MPHTKGDMIKGAVLLLVGVASLGFGTSSALAAFPGHNGPILFAKSGSAGASVYRVNADGSRLLRIGGHATGESGPSGNPRGAKVAYDRRAPGSSMFTMLLSGEHQTRLSHDGEGSEPTFFGPGGGRIAYVSGGKRSGADISVMRSNGRHKHPITHTRANDDHPDVSPNGDWIAFDRKPFGTDMPSRAFKMHPDGSGLTALTRKGARSSSRPSFSPDGKRITFTRETGSGQRSAIYVMQADGTHVKRVTRPGVFAAGSAFSPDGKRIVFEHYVKSGHGVIATIKPTGNGLRDLTPHSWESRFPDWAPARGSRP